MKIATWNVNSLKARLPNVLAWLAEAQPDVVCLQELKCQTADFPRADIEGAGYQAHVLGQKSYNGVALLSRHPVENVLFGLPGDPADEQARYVEGTVEGLRIASLYLPNGNPVGTEKYPYKLKWMSRLLEYSKERLKTEEPLILAGDFNVIPHARDVHNPAAWTEDALFKPETRESFQSLLGLGLTDALRAVTDEPGLYTFWDYQAGAWQKNHGLRIDHLLLSPQASDRLANVGDRKSTRLNSSHLRESRMPSSA